MRLILLWSWQRDLSMLQIYNVNIYCGRFSKKMRGGRIPGHRWSWLEESGSGRTECSKGSRLVTSSSASPANNNCLSFKHCTLHLVHLTRMSVSCTLENKSGPPLLRSSCTGATVSCRGWQCDPLARRVTRAHRDNTRCSCSFIFFLSEMCKYLNHYKYLDCALYAINIYAVHCMI